MKPVDKNLFDHYKQLEWACRRGMLELDVLLGNFLKKVYPALSPQEKRHFIDLLSCPDPVLFDYLLGRDKPEDAELLNMVEKIRHHARTRI